MRVLPYGRDGLLVELDDPRLVPAVQSALADVAQVVEAVAGARTVLAVATPGGLDAVRRLLAAAWFAPVATSTAAPVEIPVVYDGADLAEVSALAGLNVDEVVELHQGADYTVRFCGFSPGFAYLDGLPDVLQVQRRAEPRTRVPAGSVAIAGEFAGIYPRASPGGWRLLGRTSVDLWDAERDPPALLAPGTPVRFVRA